MSLLKLSSGWHHFAVTYKFTFHYVSIKTIIIYLQLVELINLHSTMSLLKHDSREDDIVLGSFTFHYVSIKTRHPAAVITEI